MSARSVKKPATAIRMAVIIDSVQNVAGGSCDGRTSYLEDSS